MDYNWAQICAEENECLGNIDLFLEPSDQAFAMSRGGSGRHRQPSGAAPPRQNSISLSSSTSSTNRHPSVAYPL